jgi:hypothetical protein
VFPAHVVEVAIAALGDTGRFRTAIGQALNGWNSASAERHQIVLVPSTGQRRTDAGESLDLTDVVISAFDPTRREVDDVMRDILRAKGEGKLVLAWLIAESPSHGISPDDQGLVDDLAERLTSAGISPRYIGQRDADFESRLHDAITADLTYATLSPLTERFESTASVRQVTIYRTPVPVLGPHIFAVTVANHSTSVAIDLKVLVDATRSKQENADVFAKLRTSGWPAVHRSPVEPGAVPPGHTGTFPMTRTDLLAAHTALDFPRWLRPNQHASALYAATPNACPHVYIQFEDEAGEVWSRTNDAEPESVSST